MVEDRARIAWQRRMATFMTLSVSLAALFFAIVTAWQFTRFQSLLDQAPPVAADPYAGLSARATGYDQAFELAQARAAFALEGQLIGRRYQQANLTLTTRMWTRLMGFMTGMLLALVGAAFVLGKLSDEGSEAQATAPGGAMSFSLRSASPGIILAGLGTALMALSISIQATFDARDQAIYFGRVQAHAPGPDEAIGPAAPEAPPLANVLKPPAPRSKPESGQ